MLKTTIAAPFRHLQKPAMKKSELVYYYAYDRKWMSIDDAAALLKNAEQDGLLTVRDDQYMPSFDPATVTIPLGFKPQSAILLTKDALGDAMNLVARALKKENSEVAAEMNILIKEGFDNNLLPEAALAIIARRHNVPIDDCLDALEKNIWKEERE